MDKILVTTEKADAKILRKKSKPIEDFEYAKNLAERLDRILKEEQALGIAAPQIGELVRLFLFMRGGKSQVIINPEIKNKKGQVQTVESCLSAPDFYYQLTRPESLTLVGKNLKGEEIEIKCRENLAPVIQHEYDHLDGILINKIGTKYAPRHKKEKENLSYG